MGTWLINYMENGVIFTLEIITSIGELDFVLKELKKNANIVVISTSNEITQRGTRRSV